MQPSKAGKGKAGRLAGCRQVEHRGVAHSRGNILSSPLRTQASIPGEECNKIWLSPCLPSQLLNPFSTAAWGLQRQHPSVCSENNGKERKLGPELCLVLSGGLENPQKLLRYANQVSLGIFCLDCPFWFHSWRDKEFSVEHSSSNFPVIYCSSLQNVMWLCHSA